MARRSVVLVVGPGRSGTSTMAGALAACGYVVPDPVPARDQNPRGFFEPTWMVLLHMRLLERAGVRMLDPDPEAILAARKAVTDEVRAEVHTWLGEQLDAAPHLVLKDPRMIWFLDLWAEEASSHGASVGQVVMLRPPSEVAASRRAYAPAREIITIGGWVNVALLTESITQARPRALVSYPDLVADWRSELSRVRDALDLTLDPSPEQRPHPIDDFIDPALRRSAPGWEGVAAPAQLVELADRLHAALVAPEVDPDAVAALRAEYAGFFAAALHLTRPRHQRHTAALRRKVAAATAADGHDDTAPWRRAVDRLRGVVRAPHS